MKLNRRIEENLGLRMKLMLSIGFAFIVALAVFYTLFSFTNNYINDYFDDSNKWMEMTDQKAEEFQKYITDNGYSMRDEDAIRAWNKKNAAVYLYIYTPDITIYETSTSVAAFSYENYRPIAFSDGIADMSIFYAIDYRYYMMATISEIVVSVLLFFFLVIRRINGIVLGIKKLETDIKILEGGGLDHVIEAHGYDEIGNLERSLNNMRIAFNNNIAKEEELTKANTELVTRMAHDLRTPLTSLLLYLDLLEKRKYKNDEQMDKYIKVSREKAERIKVMSDLLFERFLITGGKSDKEETAPVKFIFEDILSSFVMSLETQGFTTYSSLDWPDAKITVIDGYIDRILDNICSNIFKYADMTKPVLIDICTNEAAPDSGHANDFLIKISNRIGNRENSEGGSNIGLENIDLMLSKMGGSLEVHDGGETGEVFEMIIRLPLLDNTDQ